MSEVKRFDHVNHAHVDECEHIENPEGLWVKASDYDALAAEAQALREEVAALRARVAVVPDAANDRRKSAHYCRGWNACLDELARLNGKTVSEALLRQLLDSDGIDGIFDAQQNYAAHQELRALLNQDKENGNG
ncbi:hypothetical protein ACM795_29670 [Pseudomonas aeruginosa]|uniref:hypothetical protein n=1 Tax=Pseudomonas aeruginosa TaxID=287 RepID=UPI002A69B680|nr:hypothetical protein [Pseudomonas aeruginosa]MDY1143035.1 hypothetical protein [Pseudomonas aeruginosa]MDY1207970.1 hypothetical protein [Pseudomonas aeruginosa]